MIRPALGPDAAAIAEIFNQGVAERTATFQTRELEPDDIVPRIEATPAEPLLVAERDGRVIGWVAVARTSTEGVYVDVGEYTLYVDRVARGSGVGTSLLDAAITASEAGGYYKLIGKVFSDNAASIAVALACGFTVVGVHHRHGRLDGEWKDVTLLERSLGDARL